MDQFIFCLHTELLEKLHELPLRGVGRVGPGVVALQGQVLGDAGPELVDGVLTDQLGGPLVPGPLRFEEPPLGFGDVIILSGAGEPLLLGGGVGWVAGGGGQQLGMCCHDVLIHDFDLLVPVGAGGLEVTLSTFDGF